MFRNVRFLLPVCLLCVVASAQEFTAGAAKVSIVPPFPTHMGGFGDRVDTFESAQDELYARALALHDGEHAVIIIGSDLMAIDRQLVQRARAIITDKTGVTASHIMISCAHNHSAPSYYQKARNGITELPLEDFLVERFAEAGITAYENRVAASAGFKYGEITGATRNRQQNNEDVIDTTVGVLRIEERESRVVIGLLYNFTGHPVILGSRNLMLSGEFPGWASRTVEDVLGGVAVFTQGACGDITVHRQGDPWSEIQRLGRLIAGEVIKTAEFIRPNEAVSVNAASTLLTLPPKPIPPIEDSESLLADAEAAFEEAVNADAPDQLQRQLRQLVDLQSGYVRQAKLIADGELVRPESYEAEVQVMRIGDLVTVAVPGELFVEYALELRDRIQQTYDCPMVLVGYANHYLGYIVTPRAIQTGGYEAAVSRVHPSAGREMVETAMRILSSWERRE
jgi:hypothetical protein